MAATAAASSLLLSMATLASCASGTHSAFHGTGNGDDGGGGSGDDSGIPPGMGITGGGDDGGGGFGGGPGGSATGMCTSLKRGCSSGCTDFPTAPILDTGAPANAASLFGSNASMSGGPCISDPQQGTLVPQNWLRPRFSFVPSSGQAVFQITLKTPKQANPLVAYTKNTTWTMPKSVWDALRADSWGDAVDVTICGTGTSGGPTACSKSSFTIAPASAGGSMIYWAAVGDKNGDSWLEGFAPGDESVATTLTVPGVQATLFRSQSGNADNGGAVQCIGCHSAAPDGASVAFVDFYPWPASVANVKPVGDAGTTGQVPSWLTPQGGLQLSLPWLGVVTFSKSDWANEKVAITTYGCPEPDGTNGTMPWWYGQSCSNQTPSLMWMQLDAPTPTPWDAGNSGAPAIVDQVMGGYGTTWGFLDRTGDKNGAEFANWSHDGSKILYVSTNAGKDGRLASGNADLYTVPFNGKKGGAATPVNGASDSTVAEYYGSFSEDDQYIAFVRAAKQGPNGMYYNPYGEVYVVPAGGASSPARLEANDPVACPVTVDGQTTMPTSPGVTNSWPKWSPDVEVCADGSTYYWLVFSSTRMNLPFDPSHFKAGVDGPTSQLYMAGITVDGSGKITSYPALFIWNQPTTSLALPGTPQSNHTPVWETIEIPRHPTPTVN